MLLAGGFLNIGWLGFDGMRTLQKSLSVSFVQDLAQGKPGHSAGICGWGRTWRGKIMRRFPEENYHFLWIYVVNN